MTMICSGMRGMFDSVGDVGSERDGEGERDSERGMLC